jgi:hypothetical protein
MATNAPITLAEGNDETVLLTINRQAATDDLTLVTRIEMVIKDDSCHPDSAGTVLSSLDGSQITILTHTASEITAAAYVPPLSGAYRRFYRVDGLDAGGHRRTAMYGVVTVLDL